MTATTVPPHTLTVTETDDGMYYRLDCDGVTDACRTWQECYAPGCSTDTLDRMEEDGDDEPEVHGVRHKRLDQGWSVPTARCWLREDPDWPAAALELLVGAGVHRVTHEYDRSGEFYTLTVVGS